MLYSDSDLDDNTSNVKIQSNNLHQGTEEYFSIDKEKLNSNFRMFKA